MSTRSMLRRSALTSAVLAGALILTACSGSEPPPRASNPLPSATATATATASTGALNPAIDTSKTDAPVAPESYTEPQDVAGSFALHAMGSMDVLKATTVNDAVAMSSAYFTDDFQRLMRDSDRDSSFYVLPWDVAAANNDAPVQDAFAAVMTTEQVDSGEGYVDVETVVEFDWKFETQTFHGTRTLSLRMKPGTDETGMAWQIDGASGTDAPFNAS